MEEMDNERRSKSCFDRNFLGFPKSSLIWKRVPSLVISRELSRGSLVASQYVGFSGEFTKQKFDLTQKVDS